MEVLFFQMEILFFRRQHPGKIPKTRGEFFKECLDKKYNSGGLNKC